MSIYLARKGFQVELYERRPDMRKAHVPAGKSINLAVTARGLRALEEVGIRADVLKIAIPMKGRMIHDMQGKTSLQPYGQKEDEVIYAASRGLLNKMLLELAGGYDNISMHFERKCTQYDAAAGKLHFAHEKTGAASEVPCQTVIGADGAWSAVRKAVQDNVRDFRFSQNALEYGYKELTIPPAAGGKFRIEKNALHIWPRHNYMMIALPNTDGSFTCTLFFPLEGPESFAGLKTPQDVKAFFASVFPDTVALMPDVTEEFFANPTGALVTIKCTPWNLDGRALLIGDAAHAIVPFFAQGMNSGFEDCALLNSLITPGMNDWKRAFDAFSAARRLDTDAIADMAVENFVEMRDKVMDPKFILKKNVGFALEKKWPGRFVPRYAMVIFRPDIPYAKAKSLSEIQDRVLDELCANINSADEIDWQMADRLLG